MTSAQPGILGPLPRLGRYLFFSIARTDPLRDSLSRLASLANGDAVVVAFGPECVAALEAQIPGLRPFPALQGRLDGSPTDGKIVVPATPTALLCWLRGEEMGELVALTRQIEKALAPALHLDRVLDGFRHRKGKNGHGRDLTGYEDGSENPKGKKAETAALVQGQGAGLDGASFLAAQQWLHDFKVFEAMSNSAQDKMMGRRMSDNEELQRPPKSAHIKRTEQESFTPQAFVLRRSMPWAQGNKAGLMFVAFGRTLDAFEVQMRRMVGEEDGIVDALFQMSKPVSGAYFWCPPLYEGKLDLRALQPAT